MIDLSALAQKKPQEAESAHIRSTDTRGFENDVLAASMETPVIVDFWAPWCGPCKQMMPALEKVVGEAAGAVRLVKVNIDESPELAQAFRIQSVPMVFAFFQGQPVDGFSGARPESDLRAFVEKMKNLSGAPAAAEAVDVSAFMDKADQFFRDSNYTDAIAMYSTALDAAPENMEAMAGIGWCFAGMADLESLNALVADLAPAQKDHPRIKGLSFFLSQAETAKDLAPEADLLARLEKNPKDHAARYDLARRYLGALHIEQAIDALADLVRRDRAWEEQKARRLLVEILDALGPAHPLTAAGRRKLSAVLFS